jgi:pimeloyl-ACP methyl ester carboxylesterase
MTPRAMAAALIAILLSLGALPASAEAEMPLYKATAGPYTTTVIDREWVDAARSRPVPARLFVPRATSGETFPVVVFSHGLWANRRRYQYFAQHLASHGYVVVLPQHGGSDTASLLCLTCDLALVADWLLDNPVVSAGGISNGDHKLLQSAVKNPENLVNRPLDVSFAIDQLAADSALAQVADLTRIGVAGHSFGAYTSMAVGGMLVDLPAEHGGLDRSFKDPRVKASLSMSAQGPGTVGISDGAWSQFGVPAMFLTGTRDYGGHDAAARWRRSAFDNIRGQERFLVVLNGAGHSAFANKAELTDAVEASTGLFGVTNALLTPTGLTQIVAVASLYNADVIKSTASAFFDSYLKADPAAKAWLIQYAATAHPDATAEFRSD